MARQLGFAVLALSAAAVSSYLAATQSPLWWAATVAAMATGAARWNP